MEQVSEVSTKFVSEDLSVKPGVVYHLVESGKLVKTRRGYVSQESYETLRADIMERRAIERAKWSCPQSI
jgi:hypothetical protein